MKVRDAIRKLFYSEGTTPLPTGICLVLFIFNFFNAVVLTSVFSYIPHLVKDYGTTEVDTGRKAGILASSMFVARVFSSFAWGYISDKCGRKLSVLVAGCCLAVTTLMFAFSFNYTWAVVTRFLQGLSMGVIVIAKAYISDISDDTNLATGIGLIFLGYNIGLIVGPSMAGFLAFPAEQYPKVFSKGSFFDYFKIFIPNMIIVVGTTLTLFSAVFVLPKRIYRDVVSITIQDKKENSEDTMDVDAYLNCSIDSTSLRKNNQPISELSRLIDPKPSKVKAYWIWLKNSSLGKLLRNKDFLLSALLYGLYTVFAIGFEELFPVFAATSVQYGGPGMSTSELGLLYLLVSIAMFIAQIVFVNKMVDRFGSKKIFLASSLLFGALMPLIPLIGLIKKKTVLWVVLWFNQVIVRVAMVSGFVAVNVFINNSVESDLLGLANGIGMSVSAVGRSVGAVGFGSAFTWSLADQNRSFPFNQYFAFFLIAIVTVIVSLITLRVPESINKKKGKSCGQKPTLTVQTSIFKLIQ